MRRSLDGGNLDGGNLDGRNLDGRDLDCRNLDSGDISGGPDRAHWADEAAVDRVGPETRDGATCCRRSAARQVLR